MKYQDLTGRIIGCAMKVHSTLGNGFQELIYQRALAIEFENQMLTFARELEIPIYYDGHNIGSRRVDFFVENLIVLELKAVMQLDPAHFSQTLNYLEAYNIEIGLLINFGNTNLIFRRLENQKFQPNFQEKIKPSIL
jgi:GxxExxY protein